MVLGYAVQSCVAHQAKCFLLDHAMHTVSCLDALHHLNLNPSSCVAVEPTVIAVSLQGTDVAVELNLESTLTEQVSYLRAGLS